MWPDARAANQVPSQVIRQEREPAPLRTRGHGKGGGGRAGLDEWGWDVHGASGGNRERLAREHERLYPGTAQGQYALSARTPLKSRLFVATPARAGMARFCLTQAAICPAVSAGLSTLVS